MSTHNPVRVAVRRTLVCGVAASAALFGNVSAMAQDQDADAGELTEVVVTGSRIRRIDVEAAPEQLPEFDMPRCQPVKDLIDLLRRSSRIATQEQLGIDRR